MASVKKNYEMPGQYRFHGILMSGIMPEELYDKALLATFHKDDILQVSFPKSG